MYQISVSEMNQNVSHLIQLSVRHIKGMLN